MTINSTMTMIHRIVFYSVAMSLACATISYPSSASEATKADEPPACPAQSQLITGGSETAGVTPPKLIHVVDARFSKEARKAGRKVIDKNFPHNIIRLTVDKQGMPTNLCLLQSVGYGLDAEAGKAVRQYRFKPAMKDGLPIEVPVTVQVSFRLY